jgi:Protein of unknown function (DUF2752)
MIRRVVFLSRIWITILTPFFLMILPSTFFDKGESVCLSVNLLGIKCYGCGMTKAVMHFIHFEFQKAWEFNKLSFIVVPMLFPLWIKAFYELKGKQLPGFMGKIT